jgi:hypothetical protein
VDDIALQATFLAGELGMGGADASAR